MTTSDSPTIGLRPSRWASLAARDRGNEGHAFVGVVAESLADVGDAELNVSAFVAVCELGCGGGGGIGGMRGDEREQLEEGAFAEDVEEECGEGEVVLFEQGVQRKLGRGECVGAVPA
jgi:hypothetical protein